MKHGSKTHNVNLGVKPEDKATLLEHARRLNMTQTEFFHLLMVNLRAVKGDLS